MPRFVDLPLATPRLHLRPLRPRDAQALFGIFSDPLAMRYWSTPPWTSPQQVVARIEQDTLWLEEGSALRLALEPRVGGTEGGEGTQSTESTEGTRSAEGAERTDSPEGPAIVGTVSLFAFDAGNQRAEIGYILGPHAWGRGLMHEALQALVGYAFGALGLRRLEADIDPRNERSGLSLERLGFRREGLLRERWCVAGEVSDSALYGLLAREWRERSEGRHGPG
ncbi:MAG: GNAT family N-acetyltransferase [Rubrivivax sp.]|nr:GNAT family N-acetyltransferase [Rubrivivax sp.]